MTKLENVLIWLYVKTWGKFGEHIIEQNLWNFGTRDLETALICLAYPRKRKSDEKEKTERVQVGVISKQNFQNVIFANVQYRP